MKTLLTTLVPACTISFTTLAATPQVPVNPLNTLSPAMLATNGPVNATRALPSSRQAPMSPRTQPLAGVKSFVVDAGPHHRTWDLTRSNSLARADSRRTNAHPSQLNAPKQRITAVASGMNFWNGQQWVPSDASFSITPQADAFIATNLQHSVRLNADINAPGAVTLGIPCSAKLILREKSFGIG